MKKTKLIKASLFVVALSFGTNIYAEETATEKIESSVNKTADGVKKTYRKAKDKTCEMINGKMKCIAKKIKNESKNLKDNVETQSTEIINKID